ncbi:GIY-YIG nuclease family protein [Pseudomonas alliivorans]|nr:GIY-YIG nuclease family protein [Pseudomonas alliivorans]MEE4723013.1 GIY-YIG nuclease family protein [Pseudomonas alliivorans]MEE4759112.1 GIY-YIG nuclease family protein [Pseudomonas alliivorans]MEE4763657.1 GIY-YIG nuclease family protein [Pseudomonas alliivorans]MEE4774259.1 GIY-YIG nuclease family protein [Pseudomonas alliivorans]
MPESCAVAPDSANEPVIHKPWFVYLVRAANGSLYCGISDDPVRRFAAHQSGKGARFFCSSPAVALVYVERHVSKSEALRHERLIKKLRKTAKEVLAASYTGVPIPVSIHERDVVPST